jgi:hypothetical protein
MPTSLIADDEDWTFLSHSGSASPTTASVYTYISDSSPPCSPRPPIVAPVALSAATSALIQPRFLDSDIQQSIHLYGPDEIPQDLERSIFGRSVDGDGDGNGVGVGDLSPLGESPLPPSLSDSRQYRMDRDPDRMMRAATLEGHSRWYTPSTYEVEELDFAQRYPTLESFEIAHARSGSQQANGRSAYLDDYDHFSIFSRDYQDGRYTPSPPSLPSPSRSSSPSPPISSISIDPYQLHSILDELTKLRDENDYLQSTNQDLQDKFHKQSTLMEQQVHKMYWMEHTADGTVHADDVSHGHGVCSPRDRDRLTRGDDEESMEMLRYIDKTLEWARDIEEDNHVLRRILPSQAEAGTKQRWQGDDPSPVATSGWQGGSHRDRARQRRIDDDVLYARTGWSGHAFSRRSLGQCER